MHLESACYQYHLKDFLGAFDLFQVLLGIHILSSASYYLRMDDHPFILFQACMRPYSFYDIPLFHALKLDAVLLFTYNFINVSGNFYLFKFLKSQTENNSALKSVNKKKERKRNFVNAKSGIMSGCVLAISTIIYTCFYGLQVHLQFYGLHA